MPGKPYGIIFHEAQENYIGEPHLLNNIVIGKDVLINLEKSENVITECNEIEVYKDKSSYGVYFIIFLSVFVIGFIIRKIKRK